MTTDRSASVLARLLNRSKRTGENYNLLLSRFAIERLLYRLSISPHASNFVLKGALLFALWYDAPHRPTKDADLLGFGPDDEDTLRSTFTEVCSIDADDGVRFDAAGIAIAPIREDNVYGGLRLTLPARIGSAKLPVQVDIGFGDAVTPAPEQVAYPTLLEDMPAPTLSVYPVYTVIAEKFHAMVELGLANSRMKDFFDLWVIGKTTALDGDTLAQALQATFARRGTALPGTLPTALTEQFATNHLKAQQWQAFLGRNGLADVRLVEVIDLLTALLKPLLGKSSLHLSSARSWSPERRVWH